jgi:hypothetical protein
MGKLVVSLDGVIIKEVQLTKEKTTLGRRPYNDIVIDNLAVSGEHAVLLLVGADVFIEDLGSTNGTYINGKSVKRQLLVESDTVEVGKYKIKYLLEGPPDFERTMIMRASSQPAAYASAPAVAVEASASHQSTVGFGVGSEFGTLGGAMAPASIKVLNGAATGRQVALTKVVTTVGKPGVQVASITKRPGGYVFAHVEGAQRPTVNGNTLIGESLHLKNGDVIELAGTQMQFVQ